MSLVIKTLVGVALLIGVTAPTTAQDRRNPFDGARSWAYQLNNLGKRQRKRIKKSRYDVVVIDYARDLKRDRRDVPLTKSQVTRMKKKADGGRRLIIA